MAIILYSALISQIRGKLQGSVFSKSGAGQIITNRGVPRKTPTVAQLSTRSGFTTNARYWKNLTVAQRNAWRTQASTIPVQNRIGETVFLSGWLFFRKVMSLSFPNGSAFSILANPLAGVAQEIQFFVLNFIVRFQNQSFFCTQILWRFITINATNAPQRYVIYVSLPLSAGQLKYYGTYYRLKMGTFTGPNSPNVTVTVSDLNSLIPAGWYTYSGANHRFKIQILVGASGSLSVEKFADFAVTILPPVVFPVLTITTDGGSEGRFVWDGVSWLAVPVFTVDSSPPGWRAQYQASISFGRPISGPTVPPGTDFGPERLQAIGGPFSLIFFFSPGPPADPQNSSLMLSNAPPPYTFGADPHSPVRIRLFHTPSGIYGPYTIGSAPID